MPKYTLEILLDPSYVEEIVAAGQNIVISKQVTPSGAPLAWLSFSPYQSNVVTWEDSYAVYTSQTLLQSGATIAQLASRAAVPHTAYSFQKNVFNVAAPMNPSLGPESYEIINASGRTLTFGLAQQASLNGADLGSNAVFAATLLPGQWLDMTPFENLNVFLYQSSGNATCLGTVTGPSLAVSFGGGTTKQTIRFDYRLGGFQAA